LTTVKAGEEEKKEEPAKKDETDAMLDDLIKDL